MTDRLAALEQSLRDARAAQSFVDQATALLASQADAVKFSCANPPYRGVFEITLPRSVWGPVLQAQVDAATETVDAAASASDQMTSEKAIAR